jgi:WD40 repeat protein
MKDNPYIGPRPYERGEGNFFGRDREAQELFWTVMAEQVVLFYAQSGAGKTSLLNAQVIPALEEEGLNVLPVTRVGGDLPPDIDPTKVPNVFVYGVLAGLAKPGTDAQKLLNVTLCQHLQESCPQDEAEREDRVAERRPTVLIVDQSEELFTTHRDRWKDVKGFFVQLREALDTVPGLGVVLAMREDHVAELDPYLTVLPGKTLARFRIERLRSEDALAAVARPAENAGHRFVPDAAKQLVDNLREIKVAGGGTAPGPFVEPVLLQVVCYMLWESLPEQRDGIISQRDVESHGSIDRALADFYETALGAAEIPGTSERVLRRWFGETLITPAGTRGFALRESDTTGTLPNAAVDVLESRHIIRAEVRAGGRWYELTHDRLVEPIREANRRWRLIYHNPLAVPTRAWLDAGRTPQKLLDGAQLDEARSYAGEQPADLIAEEREFLAESIRQQEQIQEHARQAAQRRQNIVIATISVMVALALLASWALVSARRATNACATAEAASTRAIAQEFTALAERGIALEARETADANAGLAATKQVDAMYAQATAEAEARARATQVIIRSTAEANARRNEQLAVSRQLAASATGQFQTNLELGLLLAVKAMEVIYTTQAEDALRQALVLPWLATLRGHADWVNSVAYSPDGQWIVSTSNDRTVRVWNAKTGEQELVLSGHTASANSASFSPDGQRIASAGDDRTVRLWDVGTGTEIGLLEGHTGPVYSVVFGPDGKTVLSGSEDKTARLWDAETRDERVLFVGHTSGVNSVAFSPDGKMIVTAGQDRTARLWYAETGEQKTILNGHADFVTSASYSPVAQQVVTTSGDGTTRLWNANTGEPIHVFRGFAGYVWSAAFSPDGRWIATAEQDNVTHIWDIESRNQKLALHGHTASVRSVAYSPGGRQVVTSSRDGTIQLWNAEGEQQELLLMLDSPIEDVEYSPDGLKALTASRDGRVQIWDVSSKERLMALQASELPVLSASYSPDGRQIVTAGEDRVARIWDAASGQELFALTGHTDVIHSVTYSPNGQWIVTAGREHEPRLWDTRTGQEEMVLEGHQGLVGSASFSPDSKNIVTVGGDKIGYVWDISTGLIINTLFGHNDYIQAVAYSPDGDWIVTASGDTTVCVWNAHTGEQEMVLKGQTATASSVAYSPDGRLIVVGTDNGKVRIWDAVNGQLRIVLDGHTDYISGVSFRPDGKRILTGSGDRTVRMWHWADAEELIAEAGTRVHRELSCQERVQFLNEPLDCK